MESSAFSSSMSVIKATQKMVFLDTNKTPGFAEMSFWMIIM